MITARFALVILSLLPLAAGEFEARVVSAQDGDTLTVLRGQEQVRIRLHGIDAPEKGQAFGTRSKEYAGGLAFGQIVTVKVRDTDRYGRTVAEVMLVVRIQAIDDTGTSTPQDPQPYGPLLSPDLSSPQSEPRPTGQARSHVPRRGIAATRFRGMVVRAPHRPVEKRGLPIRPPPRRLAKRSLY